jgi:hypothetical protein
VNGPCPFFLPGGLESKVTWCKQKKMVLRVAAATVSYQKAIATSTIVIAVVIFILVIVKQIPDLAMAAHVSVLVDTLFCASMILSSALSLIEMKAQRLTPEKVKM